MCVRVCVYFINIQKNPNYVFDMYFQQINNVGTHLSQTFEAKLPYFINKFVIKITLVMY